LARANTRSHHHLYPEHTMTAKNIQPSNWAPAKGYANGMLARDGTLYIGGQIGWTADQVFESHDFIGQMEQALRNIVAVVEEAGGQVTDITRLTWFVINKAEYVARQREVGEVYRRVLGRHFPAMSMLVVAGLVEDDALLEIEATAFIGRAD
jgi:enamine deaminase RidA (YjgF/YER057c/UK114 family)